MSFSITFDYRFDHGGFFDDPARRSALDAAANAWSSFITDEFDGIPAGTQITIFDPSDTWFGTEIVTLDAAIDDVLIFVGAQFLTDALAFAGPDGQGLTGDVYQSRVSGNFRQDGPVTDFEPWAGTITFDRGTLWHAGDTLPAGNRYDLFSVAMHEIGHVLGIGTSPTFDALVIDGDAPLFAGVNATAQNAGAHIPLDTGLGHVEEGFAYGSVALDPYINIGTRIMPGAFDKAILADIGYEIAGFVTQGTTPVLITQGADVFVGTARADVIDGLGGDDTLEAGRGNDRLIGNAGNDRLQGGNGNETLYGGAGEDSLYGNWDQDRLSGGFGADFLSGAEGRDTLAGGDGNDTLNGGSGSDDLRGGDGDDELRGQDGNDRLDGGAGADTLWGGTGRDTFLFGRHAGQDMLFDFEPDRDKLLLLDSGFADVAAAIAATVAVNATLVRMTLPDGSTLDVFHDGQDPMGPLNTQNVSLGLGGSIAPGNLVQTGTEGPDGFLSTSLDDTISGGDGEDVATFAGNQRSYTITLSPDGTRVTDRRDAEDGGQGSDLIEGVEYLDFDGGLALFAQTGLMHLDLFDDTGNLSAAYFSEITELYIAYFNRAPDALGLFYWASEIDRGFSLQQMATSFFAQPETQAVYDGLLDASGALIETEPFVTAVYTNVLGRAPDQAGFDYWVNELNNNPAITPPNFILSIIGGAKFPSNPTEQTAMDQAYLATKTDIGVYFSAIKGMSDIGSAQVVMDLFDGTSESVTEAIDATDTLYEDALDAQTGAFLFQLAGVLDDPFAIA